MTADAPVLLDTNDQGVLTIRLNRPNRLNALILDSVQQVRRAIEDAQTNDAVRAIVLTGDDRSFSSGADLQAKVEAEADGDAKPGGLLDDANAIVMLLRDSTVPSIAAVNGAAAGVGCSLALACDYVVVDPDRKSVV